jgi:hypothetical protein
MSEKKPTSPLVFFIIMELILVLCVVILNVLGVDYFIAWVFIIFGTVVVIFFTFNYANQSQSQTVTTVTYRIDNGKSEENETAKKVTINSVLVSVKDTKYEPMIKTLVDICRNKWSINPDVVVEGLIKDKMSSGKTQEDAIEELYKQFSEESERLKAIRRDKEA